MKKKKIQLDPDGYIFLAHASGGGGGGCPHIYKSKSQNGHYLIYDPDLPEGENKIIIKKADYEKIRGFFIQGTI